MTCRERWSCTAGFTLVELLSVLAVMLIVMAVAVPSMQGLVQGRRLHAATTEFLAAIHLARSEAIRRGERVDLLAVGGNWRHGWTVIVDRNRNRQADPGDDIVLQRDIEVTGLEIDARLLDNSAPYLAYDASGRSRTDASAYQPQFGTFRFRLAGRQRNIVLNMLGRARVCNPHAGGDNC